MTRKRGLPVVFFVLVCVTGAFFLLRLNAPVPPFVSDAQVRLESYLSYSFGPEHCSSTKAISGQWTIHCATRDRTRQFIYKVNDASDKAHGFTLTAMNASARETATTDLLSYLNIKTSC